MVNIIVVPSNRRRVETRHKRWYFVGIKL
jgi:hypothetical protein